MSFMKIGELVLPCSVGELVLAFRRYNGTSTQGATGEICTFIFRAENECNFSKRLLALARQVFPDAYLAYPEDGQLAKGTFYLVFEREVEGELEDWIRFLGATHRKLVKRVRRAWDEKYDD